MSGNDDKMTLLFPQSALLRPKTQEHIPNDDDVPVLKFRPPNAEPLTLEKALKLYNGQTFYMKSLLILGSVKNRGMADTDEKADSYIKKAIVDAFEDGKPYYNMSDVYSAIRENLPSTSRSHGR